VVSEQKGVILMMVDTFGRVHTYLRISLTDNCNLRCFYCIPDEDFAFAPSSALMKAAEIEALAKVFVANGVNKIRLTGGEPLVRKDAKEIIGALSALPVSLTLTTNATRLREFADTLQEAGVRALNISLDTLLPEKFALLTRRDQFRQVRDNIDLMLGRGFEVKINAVVMKGVNDMEVTDFVRWTRDVPVHVRFIEFMPFSGNRWRSDKVVTMGEILAAVREGFTFVPVAGDAHDTAKVFRVPGHSGTFAIISTMSAPFCGGCNRLRLTADGKLKNCLFSGEETDLLTPLRRGEDVLPLILENIRSKKEELGGQFTADFEHIHPENIDNRSMITIGG
jgi:cyclic pyranopterin phosphate synthase